MKKLVSSFILVCFFGSIVIAQTTTQNYIKKTVPISPITTEAGLNALSNAYKIESINYIDGLGRTLQDVLVKGSPGNNDIVQPYYYDQYGRQSIQLLPYTDPNLSGTYRDQAYDAQPVFYTNQTKVAKTPYAYSEMVFDGSPLNNVMEKSAPDTDWKLGNGHTTKMETSTNSDMEILQWQIIANGDVQPVEDYYYNGNQLTSVKVTDANGNYSYVYTDKKGQTVCTKQFLEMRGMPLAPYYLTTYLVYDDFGQLVMVIPPKAIELMESSGNFSVNALTQDFVFRYKYDERHRLIEKKVPGTDWSYIVYNQLNQPVLFQDANLQAQSKWAFIKYDVLGRPVMSGLFNATGLSNYATRALAQTQLNGSIAAIGESEVLLDANNPWGYTNITLPNQNLDILTVNYYDDYDFDNNGTADYVFNTTSIPCLQVPNGGRQILCTPYTNAVTSRTRGYLTGSRVKVMDATNPVQWEIAAVFYDDKGQTIQSQSNDHLGGTDLVNMVYDWAGNVIHTQQLHTLSGQSNVQVLNHMYYDKMGRLTQVEQKNNNDAAIILSNYNYNELSQVIEKNIHRASTAETAPWFLQSMDYRYNIHGWLTSINNIDLSEDMTANPLNGTNDDTNDLWGMQLNYNTNTVDPGGLTGVNGTKQYTGNVSEKKWRSVTDAIKRAYGYDYDKADRLKSSSYVEYNSVASLWNTNIGRFDEKDITYDANGNILTLKRYGHQGSTNFGLIDNLSYGYNGNFLTAVTDASAIHGQMDFKDNGSTGSNEYTYDGNGNMTANPNKNITSIVYNHLNLPIQINFTGGNKIEYTYDAAGTRLRKKVIQGSVSTREYCGIFEYNFANAQPLEFMHTSEGRCVPTNSGGTLIFRCEYQYTDNTGNVVMAFTDMDANGSINPSTEVIQQSSYYAFGMRMEGLNTMQIGTEHKYKFSNKEFNDDLGLNEYDFGARFYDPAIARWGCIDPMADAAPNWTPFRYCFNNPIIVTDPTGMYEFTNWEGQIETGETTDALTKGDEPKKKWVEKYDEKQGKIVGQWVDVSPSSTGANNGATNSNPAPQNNATSSGGASSGNGGETSSSTSKQPEMSFESKEALGAVYNALSKGSVATGGNNNESTNKSSGNTVANIITHIGPIVKGVAATSKYLTKGRQGNAVAAGAGYALKKTSLYLGSTRFSVKAPTSIVSGIAKIGKPLIKYIPAISAVTLGAKVYNQKKITYGNLATASLLVVGAVAAAPVAAVVGAAYFIGTVGSYIFTGKSLEDNLDSTLEKGKKGSSTWFSW